MTYFILIYGENMVSGSIFLKGISRKLSTMYFSVKDVQRNSFSKIYYLLMI